MVDLENALDELYATEPGGFTARRNELVKALRDEGRRQDAEAVKALRKPTLPVWMVNQLARRKRRDVDLLLDAGHRARDAQRSVVAGKSADLEAALDQERRALRTLIAAAREIDPDASASVMERVSRTLRAAAVTDEGRELLARGRIGEELESSGFEGFAGVKPAKAKRAVAPPSRRDNVAARRRMKAAEEHERRVRHRLAEAETKLERAQQDVDALRAELEDAERAVSDARRKLS